MSLRAARMGDLEDLVAIEAACFGRDAWSEASLAAELAGVPATRYVVAAEGDGTVVGYASLLVVGDCSDVQRVAVRPGSRRAGWGRAMMDRLLEHARRRGCDRAMLDVRADNVAALALYADVGFAEISRRAGYYRGGIDSVVMSRPVPPDAGDPGTSR